MSCLTIYYAGAAMKLAFETEVRSNDSEVRCDHCAVITIIPKLNFPYEGESYTCSGCSCNLVEWVNLDTYDPKENL